MTTLRTRLLTLCLITVIPTLLGAQDAAPREVVLYHVSVIDMTGRQMQRDMAVLIRGDRIAAIERAAGFSRPGVRVIDLTRTFLMPGLVDMHNHLDRGESMPGPPVLGWDADSAYSRAGWKIGTRTPLTWSRAALRASKMFLAGL